MILYQEILLYLNSVLTSQEGIEDEANVSKTILGGTVQKRKKV